MGPVVNANGNFTTYGTDGAYAAGIINNSFKPLTAQAWYYDVSRLAQAYWLQADLDAAKLGLAGVTAGAQYSAVKVDATGTKEDNVYALMLGYSMKDVFAAKVSYSAVNDNGSLGYAGLNTATSSATAQSKLYTEAWWNYGQVTKSGAKSYNVTVTSPVAGLFDAAIAVTSVDQKASAAKDMTEIAVTATKKFGPLDATLAYVSTDFSKADTATLKDSNMVQAYLKLNF